MQDGTVSMSELVAGLLSFRGELQKAELKAFGKKSFSVSVRTHLRKSIEIFVNIYNI